MKRLLPLFLLLAACVTQPLPAPPPAAPAAVAAPVAAAPCNTGLSILNASAWMQSASEYDANALQAYGTARRMLDAALADPGWSAMGTPSSASLPPAIILDLDETALDNTAFEARMVRAGVTYTKEAWRQWVSESAAPPIPGAREFLLYAQSRGVTPFYVTNRDDPPERPGTRGNLEKLGFPLNATEETLLMRGQKPEWKSDKTGRREFIASTHRVLLLLGDDLNDFIFATGKSPVERDALVASHADDWGRRWIILPNAIYGSWERAYGGDPSGLSDCEQMQRKVDYLNTGSTADELRTLLLRVVDEIDPKRQARLVIGEKLSAQGRDAALALRAVEASKVPQTAEASLPANYIRVDRAEISGNTAVVSVWSGPVPKARPGEASLNCGTGRTYTFERNAEGRWTIKNVGVAMC